MMFKDNCAICQYSMSRHSIFKIIPCEHMLHEKCLQPILLSPDPLCPNCRVPMETTERRERQVFSKYTQNDRQRIVECANRGDDWASLAIQLGVKYKTAYDWIRSGELAAKKRGGYKPSKITREMGNFITELIEENCTITLKEIQRRILTSFNVTISISAIGNFLEGKY